MEVTVYSPAKSIKNERVFKVIVIGDSNVGKTTLTYRFCEGTFLTTTEATIGTDYRSKTLNLDGEVIKLQLWDTAGQERFRSSIMRSYYRNADAVILVYDVTNPATFASLEKWIHEFTSQCAPNVTKLLIGNKCDNDIKVSTNQAQKFADQYDMPLFETSAKLDSHCDHVESIFLTLAHKLKNRKPLIPEERELVKLRAKVVEDTTQSSWCSCF
ncbi:ras-related protein Rab-33B-like [Cylas formicarius]|uniref:ras-related protein Rab-33B-like n=1 Tax=Cylas formicarius TaxID=197179 RepID=UPI00295845AD|nr:ras-related protein Rab-33B-like [Cylas formicarius]XP_060531093.1 ras-related protein Rab-33B-like [Cylas formicarius]XP_060531094.1 ras-related protein Rab-33B-like [Cylas formicarius]